MANGAESGSAGAGLLEGLMGGFQWGHDLRMKRTLVREDAEERARQRARQERLDAEAGQDRDYERAVGGLDLRDRYGLEYDPTALLDRATGLRSAVGATLTGDAPAGFRRVGPSAEQRENTRLAGIRKSVGQFLSADPETRRTMLRDPAVVGGLTETGFDIDAYIEQTTPQTPKPAYSGNVDGIGFEADTPEGAIAMRDQFLLPDRDPGSDRVTQRQLLADALGEIDAIMAAASREAGLPENRQSRGDILAEANRRAGGVAQRRGFGSLQDLRDAARQMNVDVGLIDDANPSTHVPLEQRVRELRAQGVEREEARRMLRAEGYDVDGGTP